MLGPERPCPQQEALSFLSRLGARCVVLAEVRSVGRTMALRAKVEEELESAAGVGCLRC